MKLRLLLLFAIVCQLTMYGQTIRSEYLFTNGSLANTGAISTSLTQTGTNLVAVTGIENVANGAVELNGDVLNASLALNNNIADSTIAFWIKTSDNSADEKSIINLNGSGNNNYGFKFTLENGSLNAWMRYWDFGLQPWQQENPITYTYNNIADGNWHFIVLRIDEQPSQTSGPAAIHNTNYQLFIDTFRVLNSTMTSVSTGGTVALPNVQMYIGDDYTLSSNKFIDQIDNFRFYTTLIPTTEIINLYNEFNNPNQLTRAYVDANATGNNDGSSWADAFTDLQDGINAASFSVDKEVWVASGVYKPSALIRNTAFNISSDQVSLYGGFNGTETQLSERDWIANQTILSGDLQGNDNTTLSYSNSTRSDNSYNVIRVNANDITIDGFTITGGQANNTASGAPVNQNRGGAIYKSGTFNNFTLKNSIIEWNVSDREGNVALIFDNGTNNATIENCIFNNNISRYSAGFQVLALENTTVNLNLYNSLFYDNTTTNSPSGTGFAGSSFSAFANDGEINATVINNTFTNNADVGNSSPNDKGTIVFRRLNNDINNVVNVEMHNNIFFENYFPTTSVIATSDIGLMNRPTNLINSLNFTHNITANEASLASRVTNLTTNANVNSNPIFTDAIADDYRPASGSPVIDAGDSAQVPAGVTEDLDGNMRIQDAAVDIGAYESNTTTTYTLTITVVGGNGTFTPASGTTYNAGEVANITAIPDPNWQFFGWAGDISSFNANETVVMDSDKSIQVLFTEITYDLTMNVIGNGTVSPGNTTSSAGNTVSIIAIPDVGWQFDGWSGDITSNNANELLLMDSDKTVTATFSEIDYNININVAQGSGSVTLTPAGPYNIGDMVTLTAVPDSGFEFAAWQNDLVSVTNPETITIGSTNLNIDVLFDTILSVS